MNPRADFQRLLAERPEEAIDEAERIERTVTGGQR